MALDASGHYSEPRSIGMDGGQSRVRGYWHTTYDLWSGNYVSFVEPEYDSVGEFLVGVYRHYQDTGDNTFLTTVWPRCRQRPTSSNRMLAPMDSVPRTTALGENQDRISTNTFSEAFYVAGLRAAAHLALTKSNPTDADAWNGSASTILSAIQRSYSWGTPGEYNDTTGYYDQASRHRDHRTRRSTLRPTS